MTKDAKPDAWMPLYIGDWDGDTGHLDCEQDGAYGRLIRHYWRNGPLLDDDAALSRIVRMELKRWRKIRPIIAAFFTISEGRWRNKRADIEIERWADKKAAATEKAKAAAEKRWKSDAPSNAPGNARSKRQALLEQCPSSSSTEVDGPTGHSTLCADEPSEAPLGRASVSRPRVVDLEELRERIAREAEEIAAKRGTA